MKPELTVDLSEDALTRLCRSPLISIAKKLVSRFPSLFSDETLLHAFSLLSQAEANWIKTRDEKHLRWLVMAHSLLISKVLALKTAHPAHRHLHLKLRCIQLDQGGEGIGIAVVFNSLREYEALGVRHILQAVEQILPGIHHLPNLSYNYQHAKSKIHFLYLEFRRLRGHNISKDELSELRSRLPKDLKSRITSLSPSLFIPRNEEELFRNILQLEKELQYVRDLPQVMLYFQGQWRESLRFTGIVLRLIREEHQSLEELASNLPALVRFVPERVKNVGFLRKKHIKEATVFTLEVDSNLFQKRNHAIDLWFARNYLAKALERMLGPYRDYNGGLLIKQRQNLESIRRALGEKGSRNGYFIERLYYSLFPSQVQTQQPLEASVLLFSLFLETLETPLLPETSHLFETRSRGDFTAIILKTYRKELSERFQKNLGKFPPQEATEAILDIDECVYFCLLIKNHIQEKVIETFDNLLQPTPSSSSREKRTIRLNFLEGEIASLNPHLGVDLRSLSVIKALFEGLTRLDEEGVPQPAAAEKITRSSDGKSYLFSLRSLLWSNGERVTAYDFEKSWKQALAPNSYCLRTPFFFPLKNGELASSGKLPLSDVGVKALSPSLLSVELEYPFPEFLSLVASPPYSPIHGERKEPRVFNGPFLVSQWKRGKSLQLIRNPFYWDPPGDKCQKIEISFCRKRSEALANFQRGLIDWIGDPFSPLKKEELCTLANSTPLNQKKVARIYLLHLNTTRFPFHEVTLRRALSLALNRKELLGASPFHQTPVVSPLPNSLLSKPLCPLEGDPTQARALFQQALLKLGISPSAFPPIRLHYPEVSDRLIIEQIAEQWKRVLQIDVKVIPSSLTGQFSCLDRGDFQIAGCLRSSLCDAPLSHLSLFKRGDLVCNWSGWEKKEFSDLVQLAATTHHPQQRDLLLLQAEEMLCDEVPVIPIYSQTYFYFLQSHLKGIHPSHLGYVDFKHSSIQTRG